MVTYSKSLPSRPLFQTAEQYNVATPSEGRLAAFQQGWDDTFFSTGAEFGAKTAANILGTDGHLSQQEAKTRLAQRQLDFDVPEEGINSRALGIMMNRQYKRKLRGQTIAASGIGGLSQFTFTLLGSVPDPVNLIAWPFAAEAATVRGASLMSRVGSRARAGAAVGGVTAAVFEVGYAPMARALGDDYTMLDSLMNITFGGIIGGGFHVIGRGINDIRNPYAPPLLGTDAPAPHSDVTKVALAQELSGRPVDVNAALRHVEVGLREQLSQALDAGDHAEAQRLSDVLHQTVHRSVRALGPAAVDTALKQILKAASTGNSTEVKRLAATLRPILKVLDAGDRAEAQAAAELKTAQDVRTLGPSAVNTALKQILGAAKTGDAAEVKRLTATLRPILKVLDAGDREAAQRLSAKTVRDLDDILEPGEEPGVQNLDNRDLQAVAAVEEGSISWDVEAVSKNTENLRSAAVENKTPPDFIRAVPEKVSVETGVELGPQAQAAKTQADLEVEELRQSIDEDLRESVDEVLKIADAEIEEADVFAKAFRAAATCAAKKGRP